MFNSTLTNDMYLLVEKLLDWNKKYSSVINNTCFLNVMLFKRINNSCIIKVQFKWKHNNHKNSLGF
jgi:hypothetical protein